MTHHSCAEKCAAQNSVTPNKEKLGYTKAFCNILEDLTELVRHRNQIPQQLCFGKSPKVSENSVFVMFIFNVCVCACVGSYITISPIQREPCTNLLPANSITFKSCMNPFFTIYLSIHPYICSPIHQVSDFSFSC